MNFRIHKERKAKLCPVCGDAFKGSMQRTCNKCKGKIIGGRIEESDLWGLKLGDLESILRGLVHKKVRERDLKLPCISCGSNVPVKEAGHLFNANQYTGVQFDEENINGQCLACNQLLHGNYEAYVEGYIKRFGRLQYDLLKARAEGTRFMKPDRVTIIEIINTYKK